MDQDLNQIWHKQKIWQGKGFVCIGIWDEHFTNSGDVVLVVGTKSFSNPIYSKKDIELFVYSSSSQEPYEYKDVLVYARVKSRGIEVPNTFVDHTNGDFEIFYEEQTNEATGKIEFGSIVFSGETHEIIARNFVPLTIKMQTLGLKDKDAQKIIKKNSRVLFHLSKHIVLYYHHQYQKPLV